MPEGFLHSTSTLVLGVGNVGRQDDGLGWAYVDHLEARLESGRRPAAQLRHAYQLNLEDADLIHRYERVLFVDATKDRGVRTFAISRLEPRIDPSFTSHALSVPTILATAQQCFDTVPEAYLLAIRGYEWELAQGLTDAARANLSAAVHATIGPAPCDWGP